MRGLVEHRLIQTLLQKKDLLIRTELSMVAGLHVLYPLRNQRRQSESVANVVLTNFLVCQSLEFVIENVAKPRFFSFVCTGIFKCQHASRRVTLMPNDQIKTKRPQKTL